jgi:hypothetical protein
MGDRFPLKILSKDLSRCLPRVTIVALLALTLAASPSFADDTSREGADNATSASDLTAFKGKVVRIESKSDSDRCLNVRDSSRKNLTPIVASKIRKRGVGRRFEIISADNGTYSIRSAHTGRLVTEKDGKILQTGMTTADDDAQRWIVTRRSGGYVFTNVATTNRLSVSGSRVRQAGADTRIDSSQIFRIRENPVMLDGYYALFTPSGNVIALSTASIKDGTRMILKKNKEDTVGQQFLLASSPNGYHMVKNSISFKSLDIKGSSEAGGARFIQKTYEKKKSQRFKLIPSGDGSYLLKSALGPYVSVTADRAKAGVVTTTDRSRALKVRVKSVEYSSGVSRLDARIKKLHKKIGSGGNTMKKSFNYVVKHYKHRNHPNNFKGDWIARYAWDMVSKKHGHCKNFAATLCVLFRSYGYDAQVVTGYVPSRSRGWAVHGWVEATIKGKTYIFDADLYVQLGARGWYKRTYRNAPVKYRIEKRW